MPHLTRPEIEESKNRINTVIKIVDKVSKTNFTQKDIVKHELNQILTILQGK